HWAHPVRTFGPPIASGADTPIEEGPADEVTPHAGRRLAPEGIAVRNPAFDVTPARYVTAIVCEAGVARPPYTDSLRALGAAAGAARPRRGRGAGRRARAPAR